MQLGEVSISHRFRYRIVGGRWRLGDGRRPCGRRHGRDQGRSGEVRGGFPPRRVEENTGRREGRHLTTDEELLEAINARLLIFVYPAAGGGGHFLNFSKKLQKLKQKK